MIERDEEMLIDASLINKLIRGFYAKRSKSYTVEQAKKIVSGLTPEEIIEIAKGKLELVSRWRWLAAAMRFYVPLDSKHNSGPINYGRFWTRVRNGN